MFYLNRLYVTEHQKNRSKFSKNQKLHKGDSNLLIIERLKEQSIRLLENDIE